MTSGAYPPLVGPGPELTPDQADRYARHLMLPSIGDLGQRRLRAAKVAVVGAGGLGSPVLLYLAAAGIGEITIIDDDLVETSNLHRQVLHGTDDVGRPKVDSAAEAIAALDPDVAVRRCAVRLDAGNAVDLLRGHHVVVDGTDSFDTRYVVGDACEVLGIPEVWGAIYRFDGQVSVFWPGRGPVYRDLFPTPPPPGSVPSCAEGGVLGALCGVIGAAMVTEVVKLICGVGDPLVGRVLVHDALDATWRTVPVRPDPDRVPVTALSADPREVTPAQLATWLDERARGVRAVCLLDVREPHERALASLPDAVPLPVGALLADPDAAAAALPAGVTVVVYCASGVRSAQALAALRAAGRRDVSHLAGGLAAWRRAGGEVVTPG